MNNSQKRPNTAERRELRMIEVPDDRVFTVLVGEEVFGIPVACVQTVFSIDTMTPVPLAPPAIAGLLNLRGRIVTAVSLRRRLGLPPAPDIERTAIGIEHRGEALALVVDKAGDVVSFTQESHIAVPRHMLDARARLTHAVCRLDEGIVSILDMAAVFDLESSRPEAA